MDTKKLFEKYHSRLVAEGIWKSFLCGLTVAFAVNAVFALVTSLSYFVDMFKLWYLVALGAGIVIGAVVAIILYFTKFKPNTKMIARRVDRLGLDERVITMLELEKDESYIAMRQREDAKAKIEEHESKMKDKNSNAYMKFSIARSMIITTIAVCIIGLLMTTLNVLSANAVFKPIDSIIVGDPEDVTVEYLVLGGSGGHIDGEVLVTVVKGEGTIKPVCAVADDGYEFLYWTDERSNIIGYEPERQESVVTRDRTIIAVFGTLRTENMNDPTSRDIYKPDAPGDLGDEQSDEPPPDVTPQPPRPFDSTNGEVNDNNMQYKDFWSEDKDFALEEIQDDPNLSGKHKDGVSSYYDQLNPGEDSEDNF